MVDVTLPPLGEGINKAIVAFWHFKAGDTVKKGEDVVELEIDKATFNVPAPVSGRIKKIFFKEGADAPIGAALAGIVPNDP